jgi:hypothetical protein
MPSEDGSSANEGPVPLVGPKDITEMAGLKPVRGNKPTSLQSLIDGILIKKVTRNKMGIALFLSNPSAPVLVNMS